MCVTAIMAAAAAILMYLQFSVPVMPSFIKMDFSELPALITSFVLGPFWGVAVCFIKNLIHLFGTNTMGIGELSNFILGCAFVLPAGLIYKKMKTRKGAFIGSLVGAVLMSGISIFTNYFIVYPIYENFMPLEAIVKAYNMILPCVDSLIEALLIFNVPFTFVKGMISVAVTFLVYKKISPILKGR